MTLTDKSTLRPGLLVSLKTAIKGTNVVYKKNELQPERIIEGGATQERWETEKIVRDPAEAERAKVVRGKARTLITSVCAKLPKFKILMCPVANQAVLEERIAEARKLVDEFNTTANESSIEVFVLLGHVAANDAEAVRAINSEVRDLMETMESGIKALDAEMIREACNKARDLRPMLMPGMNESVQEAIKVARAAARSIVKAGEVASTELNQQAIEALTNARTAFLDIETTEQPVSEPEMPEAEARAIDLVPEVTEESSEPEAEVKAEPAPAIDWE